MKYKNKRQKKTMLLLLILLGVTVGFALLSTTLKINGTAGIKSNTWNIHWENVVPNSQSTITAETPTIGENGTKVTYEVELELPGDFYEFTVDAKNDGSINGKIDDVRHSVKEVTIVGGEEVESTATLPSYILYTVYYDGTETAPQEGDILEAGGKQTYRVRIEYDRNSTTLPESNKVYRITDEIDYVQTKETKNVPTVTPSATDPILGYGTIGDEVCIGTECFYIINTDASKTTLIAKYNLLVGYNKSNNVKTAIPTNTPGYGLQRSLTNIDDYNAETYYGLYDFIESYTYPDLPYYLYRDNEDMEQVRQEYVNKNYYVYDTNSLPYTVVEEYVSKVKKLGAPSSTTGRMPSYADLSSIITSQNPDIAKYNNGCYWLGSISSNSYSSYALYKVDADATIINEDSWGWSQNSEYHGIRPVIEIPTSSIAFTGWRYTNPGAAASSQKWEYWANGKKVMEGLKYLDGSYDNLVVGEHYYYFHEGFMYMGWVQDANGYKYFFNNEAGAKGYARGYRFENTTKTIDGVSYTFDADGKCTSNCEQAQNVLVEQ